MNFALFRKTARDSATSLFLVSIGSIGFMVLFVYAMLTFGPEVLKSIAKMGPIAKIFEASIGIRIQDEVSVKVLSSIGFTHLVLLSMQWGFAIATCTRVVTGEIERGTADLLLSLPIKRTTIFCTISFYWFLGLGVISACPLVGIWIGSVVFETDEPFQIKDYLPVCINLFALNLAIAGLTTMVSSVTNRRGHAIAFVIVVALVSATLNFIEPFLPAIKPLRFMGLLHYYRPVDIVRGGELPMQSIWALVGLATITWIVGLIMYCRKDIPVA